MKHLILTSALCLSLTACETVSNMEWPSLNPFGEDDEVTQVNIEDKDTATSGNPEMPAAPVATVNQSALQTELDEMEQLTGVRPKVQAFETTKTQAAIEADVNSENEPVNLAQEVTQEIEEIKDDIEPIFEEPIIEAEITETPDLDKENKLVEAIAEEKVDIEKPEITETQAVEKTVEVEVEPKPEAITEAVKPAVEPAPEQAIQPVEKTQTITQEPKPTLASGCPKIEIVPATKSVTKFENNVTGKMTSRASISDVRGGCEVVKGGMEIDLDILMRGTITKLGRFEGKVNEEAFITFPYFVSVIKPDGQAIDKKIMATAMRFRPSVDYVDHAEKITQFVPMNDVNNSGNYTITVGYQLTRQQLEYNRLENAARPNDKRASPDTSKATRKSYNPLAGE